MHVRTCFHCQFCNNFKHFPHTVRVLLFIVYSQLFQTIGNEKSNQLWEKHCQSARLDPEAPREIRESFIRTKYESKAWIPRTTKDSPEVLNKVGVAII